MTTRVSDRIGGYLGWCPNTPAVQTAPAILPELPQSMHTGPSDGSGQGGRVRRGVSIGTGSLKALVHDRQLLVFSFISGLILFCLVCEEALNDGVHHYQIYPFLTTISIGDWSIVFDPWVFVVEMICLFCFTLVLADRVLHRNGNGGYASFTFRQRFFGVFAHAGPLAVLSMALSLLAIMMFSIIYQSPFLTEILGTIYMIFFYIPWSYVIYEAGNSLWLAGIILFISIIPFLIALCLVPAIVRETKGLVPALAGSIVTLHRTWREVLGCCLVYGTIALPVAAVAFVIGQGPQVLIDNGYPFTMYTGHILLPVLYYGLILACLILMAAGFSAAGIAIADLCRTGPEE
jgi:hypothetical protein